MEIIERTEYDMKGLNYVDIVVLFELVESADSNYLTKSSRLKNYTDNLVRESLNKLFTHLNHAVCPDDDY